MTCTEALERVDAIAAGDLEVDAAARAHFETCPRCAAELASARRIESALANRPLAAAPAAFTANVLARIRRDQWRAEQAVDRLFNLGIVAAVLLMVLGVAALVNLTGVMSAADAAWQVFNAATSGAVRRGAPSVGTYIAGVSLFASALGMWWWAERRLSL